MVAATFAIRRALRQLDPGDGHHVTARAHDERQSTLTVSKVCVKCQ